MPMDVNTELLDSFSHEHPIRVLNDQAISASQGDRFDNPNKRLRFHTLHQLAAHAIRRFPALDLVECGCWHGHSTLILATLMKRGGSTGRLRVFDSFEGLSPFTASDMSRFRATKDERRRVRAHFASDLEHVRRLLAPFWFVDLYKGWIPARFGELGEASYGFVSIDVDLYEPTRASLEYFYPRLEPGGIMYLDDYAYLDFPGAKKAIDEFLSRFAPAFFLEGPTGSAFLIK